LKTTHAIRKIHSRFPFTYCGRTLDLARDRAHRAAEAFQDVTCERCRDALGNRRGPSTRV